MRVADRFGLRTGEARIDERKAKAKDGKTEAFSRRYGTVKVTPAHSAA